MIGFEDFRRQGEEIGKIQNQISEGRLVHAILITGESGTGKKTLATLIASALMCRAEGGVPCGTCSGCRMSASGEHPDITVVRKGVPLSSETAKGRTSIPVDDIREVIRLCSRHPYEGGNRAVVILDAENLTVQAQNSLLKILEEPPPDTYFLLTSAHPEQLLITVRSRCRQVKLIPWDISYIRNILEAAGTDPEKSLKAAYVSDGSIGKALRLVSDDLYWQTREEVINDFFRNRQRSDILKISSGLKDKKSESDVLFDILEDCVHKLLLYRIEPGGNHDISEFPAEWKQFARNAPLSSFTGLTDSVRDARRQNAFNVNYQAIIEQLLLTFTGEKDKWLQ